MAWPEESSPGHLIRRFVSRTLAHLTAPRPPAASTDLEFGTSLLRPAQPPSCSPGYSHAHGENSAAALPRRNSQSSCRRWSADVSGSVRGCLWSPQPSCGK
ncbi:Hypothetical predicted protein [Marmota monax]|uniref:Uncharacterized protein n=1 Tax=Marmota monax TaxID=9995 RepID=A0A5E4B0S5_MARMO|nr:hypothetical protein GHT09_017553 [Marmota monax]VTJ62212.1 Hypothetical predicted protein [Marmota monax]